MEKELCIVINTPYTLNFMIYIQNCYMNERERGLAENVKFPYYNEPFTFQPDFEVQFQQLWEELAEKVADSKFNEMKLFYEQKNMFKERLLNGEPAFEQLFKSFDSWWSSLAGRYAVERATDGPVQTIYNELSVLVKNEQIVPVKALHISALYDRCAFVNDSMMPYYAAYSIEQMLLSMKKLPMQLLTCFDSSFN